MLETRGRGWRGVGECVGRVGGVSAGVGSGGVEGVVGVEGGVGDLGGGGDFFPKVDQKQSSEKMWILLKFNLYSTYILYYRHLQRYKTSYFTVLKSWTFSVVNH